MNSRAPQLATVVAALLALCGAPLDAQERVDSAGAHVVRSGDTLWDLAGRYLGDPYRWPDIFAENRQRVGNPHLILPDWRLRIPGRMAPTAAAEVSPTAHAVDARTVFFDVEHSGEDARVQFAEAIESPVVTRGDFLRAGLLAPEESISPVGTLAELVSPSVVPLEIPPQIGPYARVYLSLAAGRRVQAGDRLHLMRPGRAVGGLGRIFASTGVVRVLGTEGGVATAEVETLYDAVRVGDVAVPLPSFTPRVGLVAGEAERRLEGRIVAFLNPHPLQNVHDIAFVDLGEASGVEEGDVLVAVLPAEQRAWGRRPEIPVARLRVVRTTQRTAAVKVIQLDHPALQPGLPVRLVTQMR